MLEISRVFFDHLNTRRIRYCHWKSNEHLDEALDGRTDLDLLVHEDDKEKLDQALKDLQFIKILSPAEKRFPGMEDYLGFDYREARLIHLHIHYRLVLGQRYIKNHHIPIENFLLSNLTIKKDVYIPCPELELILLIIRAHLKVDLLSLVKHAIKDLTPSSYTAFPAEIESEFHQLIQNSDLEKLHRLLAKGRIPLNKEIIAPFIENFSTGRLNFFQIFKTQRIIFDGLKNYRRNKGISIYWRYFLFNLAELPIVSRFKTYQRKTLDGKGKIISIVGADGSGKSTLTRELNAWLSWKLSVGQYYYGIPKTVWSEIFLESIWFLNRLGMNALGRIAEARFWIYVARTRRSISERSRRDASEGKIVLTDRFPLKNFHSMAEPMDGPRLSKNEILGDSKQTRCEARIYESICDPDLVLVLQVDIDELRKRKTDLELVKHILKAEAVNGIIEKKPIKIVDANRCYDEVMLDARRLVWEELRR